MEKPKLLNYQDAAAFLGVSEYTLRRWVPMGIGPTHVKLGRKYVRFTEEGLISYLQACTIRRQEGEAQG